MDRGVPIDGRSGASAHLRGIARGLAEEGHDVILAAPGDATWPRGLRTFGARRERLRLLRDAGPRDLVWERHAWPYGTPPPDLLEVNAPLAIERCEGGRRAAAERAALRAAPRVVAVSRWLADWLVHDVGCDPARVRHVPNGTGDERGDREAGRARLGVSGPLLGFVGSMRPWHGADRIPELLDALGPEWTAISIGEGPAPPWDHPRSIRLGHVAEEELPDLIAAMDVAIAPYRTSAPPWFCPLKVLAYRAQGVPVVAGDVGDCRLLVGDGGAILDTDDTDAWADAIRSALALPRGRVIRTWRHVVREALRDG
jgi:glycosyltransferase involved in cell wall biosynthesis